MGDSVVVPNDVQLEPGPAKPLDAFDRRLLGLLAEDATRSYADLGSTLGLSPPAVHERVKRLRRTGVIRRTVAELDAAAIGRPLLAFVHVTADGWGKSPELTAMGARPDVLEIHSVAGDCCLILKVRCAGTAALEALLADVYALPGIRGTKSYIALRSDHERGVRP